jgi:hypothetical protein
MLNGDAHHSEVEGEQRIRPLPRFQRHERAEGYHRSLINLSILVCD